jgi:hypothetical protein
VLREAARRDLLDLRAPLTELQATTFYVDPDLIRSLLEHPEYDAKQAAPNADGNSLEIHQRSLHFLNGLETGGPPGDRTRDTVIKSRKPIIG